MDALKVIISMFMALFYAGVTHQTPHNGIIHNIVNNTVVFNNSETLNNKHDADNNTIGDLPNLFNNDSNIAGFVNNKSDVDNKNDSVNNTFDAVNNQTDAVNISNVFNKTNGLNDNMKNLIEMPNKETFLNEITELKNKLDEIYSEFDKVKMGLSNPVNDENDLKYLKNSLEELEESITATTTEATTTLEVTQSVAVNASCLTGWDDIGECIQRKFCDYGTEAIDRTLYAKAGYQSTCVGEDMVCCPKISQLPIIPEKTIDYDDFSSDDDSDY